MKTYIKIYANNGDNFSQDAFSKQIGSLVDVSTPEKFTFGRLARCEVDPTGTIATLIIEQV